MSADVFESKVLVTGCSGFLGRDFMQYLHDIGIEALGVDISDPGPVEWRYEKVDVNHFQALKNTIDQFAPTYVIHLAARTDLKSDIVTDYAININSVAHIVSLSNSTKSIKRVIFASTQLVENIHLKGYDQKHATPTTAYGQSKLLGERLLSSLQEVDFEWCVVRPTTIWGPGMSSHYKSFFRHIEMGVYFHSGSIDYKKSYSYVKNASFQLTQLLTCPKEKIDNFTFYLCDYEPIHLKTHVNKIAHHLGSKKPRQVPILLCYVFATIGSFINLFRVNFPYTIFRLNNIKTEYVYDNRNLQEVSPNLPYSYEEALQQTIEWYKNE